ncbi:ZNF496 [Branchiostoma lanceolatum]|uniref:ZNF496 protein n=1 Tax=Branchiostoma lanceolatum TaxID=7740 RepID=A0A8K0EXU0_BRALA|nr:ZNF496 [Branchiostoma lanceolatum]
MQSQGHVCTVCKRTFSQKSNLTRHMQSHGKSPKPHTCDECGKGFAQKAHRDSHRLLHLRPIIPLYKKGEARLEASDEAKTVAKNPNKVVEPAWLDEGKAEAAAREAGGELWRG